MQIVISWRRRSAPVVPTSFTDATHAGEFDGSRHSVLRACGMDSGSISGGNLWLCHGRRLCDNRAMAGRFILLVCSRRRRLRSGTSTDHALYRALRRLVASRALKMQHRLLPT